MIKKVFAYYKLPLLISLTLAITLLALGVVRKALGITEVVIGCLLGTFILDSEYLMYAYILEPKSEFAKEIFGYMKFKDYGGLIDYINQHKHDVKDKALNSALFQAILIPISIFAVYTSTSLFIKAFILAVLANSIYKLIEAYFEGKTEDWFWAIRSVPKKEGTIMYIILLIVALVVCLRVF